MSTAPFHARVTSQQRPHVF